jgi:hypothetical protein
MRILLTIFLIISVCFGIQHTTTTYTSTSGALISSVGLNANRDSLRNGVNQCKDTFGLYTRWKEFSSHDSIFKWMNIDTIGGKVRIDTIIKVFIDTIAHKVKIDTVRNKVFIDTISHVKIDTIHGPLVIMDTNSIYGFQFTGKNDGTSTAFIIENVGTGSGSDAQIWINVPNASNGNPKLRWRIGGIGSFSEGLDVTDLGIFKIGPSATVGSGTAFAINYSGDIFVGKNLYCSTNVVSAKIITNGLQFANAAGAIDSIYRDTTFKDSLFDGATYRAYTAYARIVQSGSRITLYQPQLTGTLTTTTTTFIKGVPSKFMPLDGDYKYFPIIIINNTGAEMGRLEVNSTDGVRIKHISAGYLTAGTGGMCNETVTWIK